MVDSLVEVVGACLPKKSYTAIHSRRNPVHFFHRGGSLAIFISIPWEPRNISFYSCKIRAGLWYAATYE